MIVFETNLVERGRAWEHVCGDVTTPGRAAGPVTEPLTRRERKVAALAAAGASSRQIAGRLVLSVRTVDSHLHHAYTKLGATSRDELAAILPP